MKTPKTKSITISQTSELQQLARNIRASHETAQKLIETSQKAMGDVVREALLCGGYLAKAQVIVGPGKFSAWLSKHAKGVTHRTAYRYLKLEKWCRGKELPEGASLRHLYLECGVIPAANPQSGSANAETRNAAENQRAAEAVDAEIVSAPEPVNHPRAEVPSPSAAASDTTAVEAHEIGHQRALHRIEGLARDLADELAELPDAEADEVVGLLTGVRLWLERHHPTKGAA